MEVRLEKDVKVAVEINGQPFITSDDSLLYQNITDNEVFLFIRNEKEQKEIKIKMVKYKSNEDNNS